MVITHDLLLLSCICLSCKQDVGCDSLDMRYTGTVTLGCSDSAKSLVNEAPEHWGVGRCMCVCAPCVASDPLHDPNLHRQVAGDVCCGLCAHIGMPMGHSEEELCTEPLQDQSSEPQLTVISGQKKMNKSK